jgi:signal transduction histidine kinase
VVVRGTVRESWAQIEVTDTGPGLPAGLTELMRRARNGRGVHGRGLAIAAAVAAAHGGRLFSARPERGARLIIELPVAPDRRPARPPGARARRPRRHART